MYTHDIRQALRGLRRHPLFTAASVLTIAIAIGANTAIFGAANYMLLRGTPGVRDEGQLATVVLMGKFDSGISMTFGPRYDAYQAYRQGATRVSGVAGYQQTQVNLGSTSEAGAARLTGQFVSDNYFAVLGTRAAVGRLLDSAGTSGAPDGVVISEALWRDRFGANPAIAGQHATINGRRFTIVGVAEPGFKGADPFGGADVWFPLSGARLLDPTAPDFASAKGSSLGRLIARMKAGVTVADVELEAARFLAQQFPGAAVSMKIETRARKGIGLSEEQVRHVRQTLLMLMAGVGLVLLIACANVANLFLARNASRVREVALRRSLGAGDWVIARQMLAESVLVSLAAGVLGVVLALWGASLLEGFQLDANAPPLPDIPLDGRVLLFAALLTMLTAVIFSLPPVLRALRTDAALMLRNGSRDTRRSRLQRALVVAQVAISFVLVVGALLFLRTVGNLRHIDLGFVPENVIGFSLDLGAQGYDEKASGAVLRQLETRLRARPQLQSVAVTALAPFSGVRISSAAPERGVPAVKHNQIFTNSVGSGYFRTMSIPLLRGRDFSDTEVASRADVVIVNERLAKEFWPEEDAIGQRIVLPNVPGSRPATVIGVVGNSRFFAPEREADPFYYSPLAGSTVATIVVRSNVTRAALVDEVRREVAAIDHDLPLYDVMSISERVDRRFAEQISAAGLTGLFGIVGLLLAAIGLYAVIAFAVTQRTRELAIRIALGAHEVRIRRTVVGDAAGLVGIGVVLGGVAAYQLTALVSSRLYGVKGGDAASYVVTAVLMAAVAIVASYAPARRATRLDPMSILRSDE